MADPFVPKSDDEPLPDFLALLQGDPWIEFRWKKALVTQLREQRTPKAGGSDSASAGGRFAYRLNTQQRIRNAIRAPQAVVKIVRGGGAGSAGDLNSQLTYLSRDGELALDEYDPDGSNFDLQGKSEIKNLSHTWAQRWDDAEALDGRAARSKSKTYHLIVSFPEGTDEERAHDAANTFADKFLTSGELGDRWKHIRAWHTDRAHPHMHIVIDRRGESGRMMQINPARDISPALLRGMQVDAAAEHGLLLNDTPRVSRGLRDQGLTSPEWRAEQRGQRIGRNAHRSAYEQLTSKFADEIIRHEAQELRDLARTLDVSAALHPNQQTQERFVSALIEAAATLDTGKDLSPMEPQTLEKDEHTLEALSAMSVDDLSETMRVAVKEAEALAPSLQNETQRAQLEIETGKVKQLYAPHVPEFAEAIEQSEPYDGLGTVIDSRLGADQEREQAFYELDHDGYDNDLDPEPVRPKPSQTLGDADNRVVDAYTARGMNGERALARIKGGIEATSETRTYWHDQEIKERMRAGDIPRTEAERELDELHTYASKTYRAATRAITRGVSLEATEVYAPKDRFIEQDREPSRSLDSDRSLDVSNSIDVDEPLVIPEVGETEPVASVEKPSVREQDRETQPEPPAEKLSPPRNIEDLLRVLEEQDRATLEDQAKRDRERGVDRSQDLDDGYDL